MNLLLISETAIVKQIFSLVCKKLNLELETQNNTNVNEKFDLIIIDQNFIDDKFNIVKQFSKKLGAISSEELSFDKSRDFVIPRPFLPTKLQEILNEQIEFIKNDIEEEKIIRKQQTSTPLIEEEYDEEESVTVPITDYVESLAEDVYLDIEEDNDESIVSLAAMNDGGVLDHNELNKINDILKEDDIQNEINYDKDDWKDISDILDDALNEVRDYEFEVSGANYLELYLNKFDIDELKPLLTKLNQGAIDKLSSGEEIDLRIKLKEK